jgi:hypothetical protein
MRSALSALSRWLTSAVVRTALLSAWAVLACGGTAPVHHQTAHAPSPSPSPTLSASQVIDGIRCGAVRRPLLHFHAHLSIMVFGQPRPVPYGIGVVDPVLDTSAGDPNVVDARCYFDLHTHASDGILHVESSEQQDFTLGQFFDVWDRPLGANGVGADSGPVTAFVNGTRYTGDPRDIPLQPHTVIQLDVGDETASAPYTFPDGL